MYIPHRYKSHEMCDEVGQENGALLRFASDYCKNLKMCIKSVHNYTYALEFVHDCYETQEM